MLSNNRRREGRTAYPPLLIAPCFTYYGYSVSFFPVPLQDRCNPIVIIIQPTNSLEFPGNLFTWCKEVDTVAKCKSCLVCCSSYSFLSFNLKLFKKRMLCDIMLRLIFLCNCLISSGEFHIVNVKIIILFL